MSGVSIFTNHDLEDETCICPYCGNEVFLMKEEIDEIMQKGELHTYCYQCKQYFYLVKEDN